MIVREIKAKSILRRHKKIDSWFISRYGMNLYRGCTHGCIYCDGRSERYQVEGEFGEHVTVKTNAVEVLRRELDPERRRTPLKPSFIMMGGGVGDSYQPVEKRYELTRRVLDLMSEYRWPVHVLTKSTLVERDIDVLKKINRQNGAIVSFSFSSADDDVSAVFEPGVPPPSRRLETLALFKKEGIPCGMFLLPVIPFITDAPGMMEETVRNAHPVGVDFIIFGGMTLKEGRQKQFFLNVLRERYPRLVEEYEDVYKRDKWGQATGDYYERINLTFSRIARKYGIPTRIPPRLYRNILCENDLVIVMLEHIDYLLRLEGRRSHYGYAAYAISKLDEPLSTIRDRLRSIKGVGEKTEDVILEILETGGSSLYEKLLEG